ncbi:TIGR02281 family clan AA aspartic protease [Sphingomonas sp. ABOLD]|uniref:Aspartyl protease family protein n=1 Tax=Sphingomonas trueperi TaxID=53317 RepID=A0A7X5XY87_9SPHN|nr:MULTISPECIES: TIGR02281 family clan AA aspartic protease [unclassified Sphingomonas]NJB97272.1 aspartyl protease family protein [Sphingomonas trueperi]RSV34345.1 TIGR02281 family clan AA aspartic protease [Sphingomonas sp. ABOLE]RSV50621.1 TIGR02281 family clan AA aspartic protease [Sphingomonas sp. ABOLD]
MNGVDGVNMVWLIGALVLVVSALSVRRIGFGLFLRTLLGWAAIVLLVLFAVGHRYELAAAWSSLSAKLGLEDQRVEGDTVRIRMSPDGHFWARVTLNGAERRMLIDSGATITAISEQTAKQADIQTSEGLPAIIETANGSVAARRARIAEVSLGPLKMQDLGVVVSQNFGDLDVLGMNFLSRLHSWRVEGNVLVLEPKAPEGTE